MVCPAEHNCHFCPGYHGRSRVVLSGEQCLTSRRTSLISTVALLWLYVVGNSSLTPRNAFQFCALSRVLTLSMRTWIFLRCPQFSAYASGVQKSLSIRDSGFKVHVNSLSLLIFVVLPYAERGRIIVFPAMHKPKPGWIWSPNYPAISHSCLVFLGLFLYTDYVAIPCVS